MTALPYELSAAGELVAALVASYILGRIAYEIFFRIAKAFTTRTKNTLDDRLIESCEQPLEIGSVVFFTFVFSSFLSRLAGVGLLISRYSLAFIFLLGAFLLSNLVGAFLQWYYEEGARRHSRAIDVSLIPLIRKVSKVAILFVGFTFALGIVGLDVTGILAVTSVAALIVGLASQETLGNFFAGLALQLDRQVRYGDYFRFFTGEVMRLEKIGVRSSQFTDLDGNEVVLANSEFARQRIAIVGRKGRQTKVAVPVALPLSVKPEDALAALHAALEKDRPTWLGEGETSVSVDKIADVTYAASFLLPASDFFVAAQAKEYVNKTVLAYLQRKRRR